LYTKPTLMPCRARTHFGMTIRRDLRRLDRDGFVRRTYGGATTRVVRAQGTFEVGQNSRMLHRPEEKRQIALRAAELTADARVMYIGVGSTVEQFARLTRPREDLLVITPSLVVASLLGTRRVQVIGAAGVSARFGVTDLDDGEAERPGVEVIKVHPKVTVCP
jgi:DeoR/GlpR family transcriptional regulator of sugar metabolism